MPKCLISECERSDSQNMDPVIICIYLVGCLLYRHGFPKSKSVHLLEVHFDSLESRKKKLSTKHRGNKVLQKNERETERFSSHIKTAYGFNCEVSQMESLPHAGIFL